MGSRDDRQEAHALDAARLAGGVGGKMMSQNPAICEVMSAEKSDPHTCRCFFLLRGMRKSRMATKRTTLSVKTRFDVFKRDAFTCQYCGAHPPDVVLEADHINPVAAGGLNEPDNLVTSCFDCNRGKGDRLLSQVPKSLNDKAAEITEREAQLAGYQAVVEAQTQRIESECWRVIRAMHGADCNQTPMDEFLTVKRFVKMLGLHEVLDAVEVTHQSPASNSFRYFCGVCWKKSRDRGVANG